MVNFDLIKRWMPRPELVLFIAFLAIYYASHFPIAASNEGSHFAAVRAFADEGSLYTDNYIHHTAGIDLAYKDGHFYLDRPPGVALLGVPLYKLASLYHDMGIGSLNLSKELVQKHFVTFWPVALGAGCLVLLLILLRQLGCSEKSAWTMVLIYGLGSQHWKFSAMLFSHVFLEFPILLLWVLMLKYEKEGYSKWRDRAFWLTLGALPYFGYEGMLLWPLFVLGYATRRGKESFNEQKKEMLNNGIWFSSPVIFLMMYHTLCWGAPWRTFGPFHNPYHFGDLSFDNFFNTPYFDGLYRLLFQFPGKVCPIGAFVLMPVLYFSLWGLYYFFKEKRGASLLVFSMSLLLISFFGKRWDPCGGSSGDPRYIVPILPLMFVPAAFWIDNYLEKLNSAPLKAVMNFTFWTFSMFSVLFCLLHFSRFHGHDFDFKRDVDHYSLATWEAFHGILSRAFVSWERLEYFWVLLALLAVGYGLIKLLQKYCCRKEA